MKINNMASKKISYLSIFLYVLFTGQIAFPQSKGRYLKNNRFDMTAAGFKFPQSDFNIIGYGAYHGSQSTEKAEHILLETLINHQTIGYYLPETDFSIAYYFNQYLKSGDTVLLKNLVKEYGKRVPQEKSIQTYKKWIGIKKLNDKQPKANKIEVVGIDLMVSYKYAAKQLLELLNIRKGTVPAFSQLVQMVKTDTADYSPNYNSYSKRILKSFVNAYEAHPSSFKANINDQKILDHLINNIKLTFEGSKEVSRDQTMFNNYMALSKLYPLSKKAQFLRMGFAHLEKSKEGNRSSFFSLLIAQGIYKKEQVISVIGYLTKSRVFWDVKYDTQKNYIGYTTEGGFGIGDYWKEHFKGISRLKANKISDLTLFRLNQQGSPYSQTGTDLMEIQLFLKKSNQADLKGRSTTDYLDYALLISNSSASTPIEALK